MKLISINFRTAGKRCMLVCVGAYDECMHMYKHVLCIYNIIQVYEYVCESVYVHVSVM